MDRNGTVFTWFSNDGNGEFTSLNIDESIQYPQDFVFQDMDGDGDHDIVMVSGRASGGQFSGGQVTLYLNGYGSEGIKESASAPATCTLLRNHPNPFNPTTMIEFELTQPQRIQLAVYDMRGRRVAQLAAGSYDAGTHSVQFDGGELASGVYLCRLSTGKQVTTRKMVLIR